jgi:hypothetical protein
LIDLGSFFPSEKDMEDYVEFEEEMKHFTKHFRKWSVKKYPEIVAVFDQMLNEHISKHEK